MKTCTKCNQQLPLTSFAIKSNAKQTLQSCCRACQSLASKAHYHANKTSYMDRARKRDKECKQVIRDWLWDYLMAHPCIDCGETDPIVLEFDHRIRSEKLCNISTEKYVSLRRVKEEVAKCDVRCANCHRRRTAKQFNWWKLARVYPHASNVLEG